MPEAWFTVEKELEKVGKSSQFTIHKAHFRSSDFRLRSSIHHSILFFFLMKSLQQLLDLLHIYFFGDNFFLFVKQ